MVRRILVVMIINSFFRRSCEHESWCCRRQCWWINCCISLSYSKESRFSGRNHRFNKKKSYLFNEQILVYGAFDFAGETESYKEFTRPEHVLTPTILAW